MWVLMSVMSVMPAMLVMSILIFFYSFDYRNDNHVLWSSEFFHRVLFTQAAL